MNIRAEFDHLHSDTRNARDAGDIWRRRIVAALDGMRSGTIRLRDVHGTVLLGQADGDAPLSVTLQVHDPAFYRRVALHGSVGAGEAYIDRQWDCGELVSLVRLLVRNRDRLDAMEGGLARFGAWALRGWEALSQNTRSGSRRNISAHYDLGNALFEIFLSQDMMYS